MLVLGVHELHVWQLSEAQTVASVHVVVPKSDKMSPVNGSMEDIYMELANQIKIKLHAHGVHSTTVQPEFVSSIEDNNDSEVRGMTFFTFLANLLSPMFI